MHFSAITWNLFHGRDFPPDPSLFTWRSWLLGIEERNATHVQVNRDLFSEFAGVLAEAEWDVALLQELPPRWAYRLADTCSADMQLTLTSRNWLRSIRRPIAQRLPDLMGAWEGGANAILARGALRSRLGSKDVILRGPPERRIVTFARLDPTTGPHAIDHLLARGLDIVEPPTAWPEEAREVPAGERAIRLSDHAPV